MEDKIFLLVKVTIITSHSNIHDAIAELQNNTELEIGSSENVMVIKTDVLKLNTGENKS